MFSIIRKSFENFAQATGFPVDQLNFIAGMIVSLFLAVIYNILLSPQKVSRTTRLAIGLLWGIAIGWLCYSSVGVLQLIILPSICYIIICIVSPQVVHKYIFTVALSWLSMNHVYRQVTDYGGYKLDISGPLMLITQRVTYVGYALHDGLGRDLNELTKEQKEHSSKKKPSMLEFFSYILHFSMLLAGPSCSYFEYMEFIDGVDVLNVMKEKCDKNFKKYVEFPLMIVVRKTLLAFIFLGGVLLSHTRISFEMCIQTSYPILNSLITKVLFAYVVMAVARIKYYFAWTFAEAINNATGMGFNGYDKEGNELWDRYTNCNIKNIEFATNSRMVITNWNISTVKWLKRTIYDRTEHYSVLKTYIVSAFWHGFYPGYYLCFISAGLITLSSRVTRHSFRAYFQESQAKKIFYDCSTWLVTMLLIVYNAVVFLMLHLESAFIYWRSMYFFGHVLTILGFTSPWLSKILGMNKVTTAKRKASRSTEEVTDETTNSLIKIRATKKD